MIGPVGFPALDGYRLAGILFRPETPNGCAVMINSATGVRQEYYAKFASCLLEHGFTVLTYDYRGIGSSLHGPLRDLKHARMRDWGRLDAGGALEFLAHVAPGEKLSAVGHSFGGQAFGLMPGNERLSAVLAVGSQSGYWKHWPARHRYGFWLMIHALIPASTPLAGYCPSTALGLGDNLPAGVGLEWASWCRDPGYHIGVLGDEVRGGFAAMQGKLRAYWITDDRFAPRRAVEAFIGFYPNAQAEIRAVVPRELGARSIGHFGFFRERWRESLWREAAQWLAAH
ncbi:MAG: alpha/beta fold hydrolase [Betaproteobacteria bacterium]|nr:alpha/beta fold hydrolase [Betaproteobacteria bacterium]